MKVGDYVRTKGGNIIKIEEFKSTLSNDYVESINKELVNKKFIVKSSPNIIDLIEVGDYVNGYMVENISAGLNGDIIEIATGTNYFQSPSLYNEDIKSIVTKERFESMEYKVG